MEVEKEYKRIKKIFDKCDDKQLELLEGTFYEAARLRVELDDLNKIVNQTGLVKVNPNNITMQKELPVSKLIVKTRANYLNYISKLSNILGRNVDDDEDEGLNEFE